jgi:ABC-type branched-subunit amino acid transport system substrate-binding protein
MKKTLSLVLVLSMIVLAFAGCGKKSKVAQGVAETVIKVGNAAATSGKYAAIGTPFNSGIQAYLKKVNDEGGIDGKKIEFVHYDDEFDPVKGKAITESLINDDKVFAILGHFGTPTVGATLDLLKETGIPTVHFATGIGALYNEDATSAEKGKGLFPIQPIYITEGRLMVARAIEMHQAKKIGVIYTNDDAGKDILAGVENQIAKLGGEYTVVKEQINPDATDVSSAALKLKEENVDAVVAAAIQSTYPTIIKGLINQGVSKPVYTSYVNADPVTISNFAADYSKLTEKFPIYALTWVDRNKEAEVKEFQDAITAYGTPEYIDNVHAMTGWIAANIFVEGLRRCEGEYTWEKFMETMEKEEFQNPLGGILNFANGQRLGTQSMSVSQVTEDALGWETVKPIEDLNVILDKISK